MYLPLKKRKKYKARLWQHDYIFIVEIIKFYNYFKKHCVAQFPEILFETPHTLCIHSVYKYILTIFNEETK